MSPLSSVPQWPHLASAFLQPLQFCVKTLARSPASRAVVTHATLSLSSARTPPAAMVSMSCDTSSPFLLTIVDRVLSHRSPFFTVWKMTRLLPRPASSCRLRKITRACFEDSRLAQVWLQTTLKKHPGGIQLTHLLLGVVQMFPADILLVEQTDSYLLVSSSRSAPPLTVCTFFPCHLFLGGGCGRRAYFHGLLWLGHLPPIVSH